MNTKFKSSPVQAREYEVFVQQMRNKIHTKKQLEEPKTKNLKPPQPVVHHQPPIETHYSFQPAINSPQPHIYLPQKPEKQVVFPIEHRMQKPTTPQQLPKSQATMQKGIELNDSVDLNDFSPKTESKEIQYQKVFSVHDFSKQR